MGFEDDLRRVEEHVAEAGRFVQRQKGLIVRLRAAGVNTLDAQRILWLGVSTYVAARLYHRTINNPGQRIPGCKKGPSTPKIQLTRQIVYGLIVRPAL